MGSTTTSWALTFSDREKLSITLPEEIFQLHSSVPQHDAQVGKGWVIVGYVRYEGGNKIRRCDFVHPEYPAPLWEHYINMQRVGGTCAVFDKKLWHFEGLHDY